MVRSTRLVATVLALVVVLSVLSFAGTAKRVGPGVDQGPNAGTAAPETLPNHLSSTPATTQPAEGSAGTSASADGAPSSMDAAADTGADAELVDTAGAVDASADDTNRDADSGADDENGSVAIPQDIERGKPPANLTSGVAQRLAVARDQATDGVVERVTVRLNAKSGRDDDAAAVARRNGATVQSRAGSRVVVELPADAVYSIRNHSAINYIQLPAVPHPTTGSILSEGVASVRADDVHAEGYAGGNATVAVIDLAFDASNPEIEPNVVDTKAMTTGETFSNTAGAHGTAVAEVVADTAPNVSLVLIDVDYETEWINAYDYAESAGADVTVASLGLRSGPFDGSGPIGAEIEQARANGISSFLSAGNAGGGKHLNVTWTDPNGNNWLNFDGIQEGNRLTTTAGSISVSVSWNDYPHSNNDYDVLILDSNSNVLAVSQNPQTGTQAPEESVTVSNPGNCPCFLAIFRHSADGTADFDIFTNDGTSLQYATSLRSLTRPATDEAAISVGAMDYRDLALEPFSSRGMTIDGRLKPEFTAPDGVSTSVYGTGGFFGTSAAAPHAAGAAALLADANATLTPAFTETLFNDTARQTDSTYGSPDPNHHTGHGLIDVNAALDEMRASNAIPSAANDTATVAEDTTLIVPEPGVLANDSDADGDALTAAVLDGVSNGTLSMSPNGSYTYSPDANVWGTDSFVYEVADGHGGSDTATVTISVAPVNDAPVAWNDTATIAEDTSLTVAAPGVLENDTDADGDALTATVLDGVSNGTLSLAANGSYTYTPDPNFWGTDSFDYEVTDGNGGTDNATVTIAVTAVNDAPLARNDTETTDVDTTLSVAAPGVLGNDMDVEGDHLTVSTTPVSGPAHGTLSLAENGSFSYTPDGGYTGSDRFTYRVVDGNGGSATATVDLTVSPPTPLAEEWSFTVPARVQSASVGVGPTHVFAGSLDDTVYGLYRANGTVDWAFDRAGSLSDSSPTQADGRVFVGSGGGTLYALSAADGAVLWSATNDSAVVSSPTVAGGTVYVGSNDGTVFAHDAATGALTWARELGAGVLSTPAVAGGSVYLTTDDGRVVALDAATGATQWSADTGAELGHSSPILADGRVVVAADSVVALYPENGTVDWQASYGGTAGSTPAFDGTRIVVGSADGSVYAFDPADGTSDWSSPTGGPVASGPALVDGRVVVGSTDGTVYLLAGSDGSLVASTSIGPVRAEPVVANDVAFVGGRDGSVVALGNVTAGG